ncbi:MAG: endonuclease [Bacteroidales bacterium]
MRKGAIVLLLLVFFAGRGDGQPPAGYYLTAEGKTGIELKQALHNIIKGHTESTYADLWTHFVTTDSTSDGKVWDMYSDIPGGTPPYVYTFGTDQCGNYQKEGDCYNREHSFPKSWFGGEIMPMYTDLFHLYPTDGWVNNKRGNYPFGVVASATWTSQNGSKLGSNNSTGYNGTVFEPIDAYKGDLARTMLYMAVRYYGEDTSWPAASDMVTGAEPKSWAISMLLHWHNSDPVSQKEIDRNNAVYGIQTNRNPFIDKPEYAQHIWGDPYSSEGTESAVARPVLYPLPARESLTVSFPEYFQDDVVLRIISLTGREVMVTIAPYSETIFIELGEIPAGIYLLTLKAGPHRFSYLLPVIK